MLLVLMFLMGLIIGSFLNVCASRLPRQESVIWPPSSCDACRRFLKPWELVPVASWLFLKGRCRTCRAPIPWRYPLIELAAGFIFLFLTWKKGWQPELAPALVLSSFLLVIALIDLDTLLIPNRLILWGTGCGIILQAIFRYQTWPSSLAGFLAGAAGLLVVYLLGKGKMGGGDVKLAGMIGIYTGWPGIWTVIFLAALAAALTGILLLGLGRIKRSDPLPFGPFLAWGALIQLLWGQELVFWYLNTLM